MNYRERKELYKQGMTDEEIDKKHPSEKTCKKIGAVKAMEVLTDLDLFKIKTQQFYQYKM